MDKRTILAVVLSAAVMYIFSILPGGTKPKPVDKDDLSQTSVAAVAGGKQQPENPSAAAQKVSDSFVDKQEVKVETDLFTALFSSRGAGLKRLTLKRYNEELSVSPNPVVLGDNADPNILNFSTQASGFNLPASSVYTVNTASVKLSAKESKQLIFNYISNQGYTVRKTYTFTGDAYGIKLETTVFNNSSAPLVGAIQHLMTYPAQPKVVNSRFETAGSYLFTKNSLEVNKIADLEKASKKYESNVLWAGFADKFFISSILSDNGSLASIDLIKSPSGFMEATASSPQFTIASGKSSTVTNMLFIGPKDIDILKAQGNSLEQSLDLGWFTILAKPLLYGLKFFYRYIENYGVAIIIITVLLKLLFFPLTHKSYKSMKDMQKIQPMMAELKDKYKNDKDAMNKAVMELYRDNKVNPLGGCLPMVVQIPVFFALYKALMFSIELRHAPFFLWINDLSGPDNLFGNLLGLPFVAGPLPIVMGVTMFIQQKLTPTAGDPLQQKMMLALPLVFTVMFLSFPSGLVLYWLVNNVLTIGQQIYINKSSD